MLAPMLAPSAGGTSLDGCSRRGIAMGTALAPHSEPLAAIVPRFGQSQAGDAGLISLAGELAIAPPSADAPCSLNSRLGGPKRARRVSPLPAPARLLALAGVAALQSDETPAPPPRATSLPKPAFGSAATAFDGDFLIVAAGVAVMPNFEGSSQKSTLLAGAFAGNFGGIGISPRAAGFALDLVPERPGAKLGFSFGPVFRLRMNRAGTIKDPVVASLGKLRTILEGGVNLGITIRRPFNGHDQLSIGADFRWDISGKGGGGVISPSVSYLTPVSKAQVIGVLASAEVANTRFARYNYDITPAGSAASGLPVFTARGGLKSLSFGAFTARDLDRNLLNGGFSIGAGFLYTALKGSAARTPITAQRGRRSQWVFAAGLGYTF